MSKKNILRFILFSLLIFIIASTIKCNRPATGPVHIDISIPPFKLLSEYHFFKGKPADLIPNDRVLPYDLITPLFSDYASKLRFVWMPEGTSAVYNDTAVFALPVGAVLIKNFYYPNDYRDLSKGRKIMETRLLVHKQAGWEGFPYIWNDEQTEATLEVAGGRKDISWIDAQGETQQLNYVIPNKNQCKGCHDFDSKLTPIGPKARNLNKEFAYNAQPENQLLRWASAGYLKNCPSPANAPKVACWNDPKTGTLNERARAYLDVNCAHCHNPHGPGATSGLFLDYRTSDPTAIGICKAPVAAGRGAGNFTYDIVPGDPSVSILAFRMESPDPGIMMPELGRKMMHKEGVKLICDWIASFEGKCK